MVIPNLIHPVPITIQVLDKAGSIVDEDHREPVQQAKRLTDEIVFGQPRTNAYFSIEERAAGLHLSADGYVLFRYVDLEAKAIVLKENDRFKKIGHLEVDVYVNKITPVAQYSDQNGPAMLKAYYADRFPSKRV